MRNKKLNKVILIALALIMAFSFTACANVDPSDDGSDVETITVKMNIIYTDGSEGIDEDMPKNVKNYEMHVEDSATVLQIIQSYAAQENIEVIVDDTSTLYITSINGVEQGETSGWVYEINGESVMEGSSEYVPEDGDEITWRFMYF